MTAGEGCPYIFREDWNPKERRCKGCGERLPRYSRIWCKTVGADGLMCGDRWTANHDWGSARQEALRRSGGHCAHCGTWLDVPYHQDCGDCDAKRTRRLYQRLRKRKGFWNLWDARRRWWSARLLDRIMRGRRPEVNHIEPRNGQGYRKGCHHHQSNLETLCHTCHVRVTTEQRRARKVANGGGVQIGMEGRAADV